MAAGGVKAVRYDDDMARKLKGLPILANDMEVDGEVDVQKKEVERQENEVAIRDKIHSIVSTLINTGVSTSLVFGIGILEPLIQVLSKIINMGPEAVQQIVELITEFINYFIKHYKDAISTVGTASNISILEKVLNGLKIVNQI